MPLITFNMIFNSQNYCQSEYKTKINIFLQKKKNIIKNETKYILCLVPIPMFIQNFLKKIEQSLLVP